MFKTIITPSWQSEKAEVRLKSIAKLNPQDPAQHQVLLRMGKQDTDQEVRRAALFRLDDPLDLLRIATQHADQTTSSHADAALHQLLANQDALSTEQSLQLATAHPELRISLIKYSAHASVRNDLLAALSIAEQTELIGDIHYTETRQKIAAQIEQQSLLEQARNLLKGKDKTAEKIVRGKLEQIHAQQQLEQQQFSQAELIVEKVELLAKQQWAHDSEAKFSVWQQRWQALGFQAPAELQRRYDQASELLSTRAAEQQRVNQAAAKQTELAQQLEEYCQQLASMEMQLLQQAQLLEKHKHAVAEWAELIAVAPATTEIAQRVLRAKGAISSTAKFVAQHQAITAESSEQSTQQLSRALRELQWPPAYLKLTAAAEVQQSIEAQRSDAKQSEQAAAAKLDKLHKRINRLLGTSKRGDLPRAKGELAALSKAASHYQGKEKDRLDERLSQASELVQQMSDWEAFATEPKLIELCEAMEKLVGSKLHPDKLASAIAKQQEAWKALGQSASAEQHWPRFKEAADAAYQPCAEFFEERRKVRQKNLQAREPLVEQMRSLLNETDWQGEPDYKAIENQLQSIHQAWQKIKDVERRAGQKQWKRISKLRAAVYEKLDAVYDSNIELKQQLIAQAKALLAAEVKDNTLDQLKFIQSKWKQIGVTRRKQDQAAWQQFKQTTDAVFDSIQAKRKAHRAAQDDKVQGHRDVIEQIVQLAKSAENLAQADHQFERLESEWEALPGFAKGLPEKLCEKIMADYQRAESLFNKTRQQLNRQQKQGALDLLQNKAALVAQLEALAGTGQDDQINQLLEQIDSIEIANKEQSQRMQKRIEQATQEDRDAAAKTRRAICLDLEILLGVDSPAEDAALRTQIQLERMKNQGLGQPQIDRKKHLEQQKLDWLLLPGAEAKIQKALDQRFNALLNKA